MLLARAGLRVLVVDRSRYGADTLSTHGLLRAGVIQLARWELLDQVVAAGTPPVRRTTFHYGDERITVPIKPGPGFDALYAPRRTVLDPILVDAARAAGADVRFGITVTGLDRGADGRVIGITGHDDTGSTFSAGARFTVGADGMNSTVARLTGAPTERAAASTVAFTYGYWDGLDIDGYELYYRPGVAGGAFPTNDGQVCVFAGTTPARFRAGSATGGAGVAADYLRLLDELAIGGLDPRTGARPPERLRVFTGRPGYVRRSFGPGWALVGDAGYFKDPVTAHGISDALRDAELLARAIVSSAITKVPEPIALAGYQATRNRLTERFFTTTEAIASFDWDLPRIAELLVELSQAMNDEVAWLTDLDAPGSAA
jgi:flavin-dependent dehydrogenase